MGTSESRQERLDPKEQPEEFQEALDKFIDVAKLMPDEVGDFLGGKVGENLTTLRDPDDPDSFIFTNACAIRMSYTLNQSGITIPYVPGKTSSDAEGNWYFFRVKDLEDYLTRTFGEPDIVSDNPEDFLGHQGIMQFVVDDWDDATGHFSMFDGLHPGDGHDYSQKSTVMKMWTFKEPEAIPRIEGENISYGRGITLSGKEFDDLAKNKGLRFYELDSEGHFSPDSKGIITIANFGKLLGFDEFPTDARWSSELLPDIEIREVRDIDGHVIGYFANSPNNNNGFYLKPDQLDLDVLQSYAEDMALNDVKLSEINTTLAQMPVNEKLEYARHLAASEPDSQAFAERHPQIAQYHQAYQNDTFTWIDDFLTVEAQVLKDNPHLLDEYIKERTVSGYDSEIQAELGYFEDARMAENTPHHFDTVKGGKSWLQNTDTNNDGQFQADELADRWEGLGLNTDDFEDFETFNAWEMAKIMKREQIIRNHQAQMDSMSIEELKEAIANNEKITSDPEHFDNPEYLSQVLNTFERIHYRGDFNDAEANVSAEVVAILRELKERQAGLDIKTQAGIQAGQIADPGTQITPPPSV